MRGQLYPYPRAHKWFQISLIEDHQAPLVQVRQDPSEVQLDEAVISECHCLVLG